MSTNIFSGPQVDLPAVLAARENRQIRQITYFKQFSHSCLLSITMNIPGSIKSSDVLTQFGRSHIQAIRDRLNWPILMEAEWDLPTGWEYEIVIEGPAKDLKMTTVSYEEEVPGARLLDLDVLVEKEGFPNPISRTQIGKRPRSCFVCGQEAKVCSRQASHSLDDLRLAIEKTIKQIH